MRAMKSQEVLLRLYDRFNRHELAPPYDLFAADAVVECPPFGHQQNGPEGWRAFVDRVSTAFPDGRFRAQRVSKLADSMYQCLVVCNGTHRGPFDAGNYGHRSGCSKLFIIVPQGTPLRRTLQTEGYVMTLESADLLWCEKTFRKGP